MKPKEKLPDRDVRTRAGDIHLERERWHCRKCRILFFPLDNRLHLGTEGYSPQPEPPAKFLEPTTAARLALEIKSRGRPALGRQDAASAAKRKKRKKKKRRIEKRVRTVVATMADSDTFGWQMAAEVQRRGLDRAKRKACVCDGQKYNWTLFELHLLPMGFLGILDFLHLLAYLYVAAHALHGKDKAAGWKCYEQWLRWACRSAAPPWKQRSNKSIAA